MIGRIGYVTALHRETPARGAAAGPEIPCGTLSRGAALPPAQEGDARPEPHA